jgi:hypothetical protein
MEACNAGHTHKQQMQGRIKKDEKLILKNQEK